MDTSQSAVLPTISLPDEAAAQALGRRLAALLADQAARGEKPVFAVLLYGGLGAGKTTLTRALVKALPGGDAAEAASPSFNLVNSYPTRPPVAHFDLYRHPAGLVPEELWECLDEPETLVIVEWAERISHAAAMPEEGHAEPVHDQPPEWLPNALCVRLEHPTAEHAGHLARLDPRGEAARLFTERILKDY